MILFLDGIEMRSQSLSIATALIVMSQGLLSLRLSNLVNHQIWYYFVK